MALTQDRLKQLFEYDNEGTFVRKSNNKKIKTNQHKHHRYFRLNVDGKTYSLHRLIFMYHYGYFPKQIDHIDNDRFNNRIENLRETTQSQNCLNRVHHSNSKNKYKNVYENKYGTFSVQITIDGIRKHLGTFKDINIANQFAIKIREKFHGQFANHGGWTS